MTQFRVVAIVFALWYHSREGTASREDAVVGPLFQALGKVLSSPAGRALAKKAALMFGPMVVGAAAREASMAAQEKITEKERDGKISEGTAATMRTAVRVVEVGSTVAAGAVAGQASKLTTEAQVGMGDALRQAVREPGATARTSVEGHNVATAKPGWQSARRNRSIQDLQGKARYLVSGETADD
jgi:hypothetical protein